MALSVATASSYVLLFGVYEIDVSGPRGALLLTCFHMRHWVICPCGCLEDTRDSNLTRSSSQKYYPPVLLFAVYEALVVYEALESGRRRALHVSCFVCVTAHLSVLLFGGYEVLESVSFASLLMCLYCSLEDTRYSDLARSSSASFHTPTCTRLSVAELSRKKQYKCVVSLSSREMPVLFTTDGINYL